MESMHIISFSDYTGATGALKKFKTFKKIFIVKLREVGFQLQEKF